MSNVPELVPKEEEESKPEDIIKGYIKDKSNNKDTSFWHSELGRYHASDTGKCIRKLYYKRTLGKRMDEDVLGIFELGHMIEDFVEKSLIHHYGERKVKNSKYVKLELEDFVIVGETDPVIEGINSNVVRLFEVKSTKDVSYKKEEPDEQHVMQVHPYMKALELNKATVIYVDKNTFEVVSHNVSFSDEAYKFGVDRISTLHTCLENERIPKAEPFLDWECKFCPYDECPKNKNGR